VAPFNNISKKIILTKNGKMQRMKEYEEKTITNFILNQ